MASAAAIRASSTVTFSSRCNYLITDCQLTHTILFYLFRYDGKDAKYFNHDLHNRVRHRGGRWDLDISLQTSEDVLYALEEVNEQILTSSDSLSDL